jgi:DNA-binding transcriptional regulator YdaS (Cro superfamily)
MTLNEYLERAGSKSLTALSGEVGVSKGRLSQLRNATEWPPELALKIEAATNGMLSATQLSGVIAQARAA